MLKYIKRNQLQLSVLFTVLVLVFVLLAQDEEQVFSNWFRKSILGVSSPVHRLANFISGGVTDLFTHYVWLQDVLEENQQLKVQIATLQTEQERYLEKIHSYDRIAGLLKFQTTDSDSKILASVVAEFQQIYSKLILLNKGSKDGVKNNFGVIAPTGVVGKVILVNNYQSVVRLVTDVRSASPVQIQTTRAKALLQGGQQLSIQLIDKDADLQIGMRVVASGLAGIYPKGTLVGHIGSIGKGEASLFQEAEIIPAVDFSQLEEVFIILKSVENQQPTLFTEDLGN